MKKTLMILSLALLALSCKKREYPEEKTQLEPEDIFVNATVDKETFNLKIGTDNYYCYSSYSQNTDSVYMFKGELKKYDCNPCPISLMVELSDTEKRIPGSAVPVETALGKGSRTFIPGFGKTYRVQCAAKSNKAVASIIWKLENGTTIEDTLLFYDFGKPGPQTLSLTVKTEQGCESTVENTIYVYESGVFACDIKAQNAANNHLDFIANIVGGKAPYQYTWYFGDGQTSNEQVPAHDYQWPGSYPVKVRIEDAEGRICESNFIAVAGNDLSSCSANMSVAYLGSKNVLLNGVKIQWTDRANTVLRSDKVDQPAESYFEIVDSQEYDKNEKGDPGRLLTLRFKVLLQGGNRKIWFKSDNTVIAVSYK